MLTCHQVTLAYTALQSPSPTQNMTKHAHVFPGLMDSTEMAAIILPIANFIKFIQFFIHIYAIIHCILLDLY